MAKPVLDLQIQLGSWKHAVKQYFLFDSVNLGQLVCGHDLHFSQQVSRIRFGISNACFQDLLTWSTLAESVIGVLLYRRDIS